MVQKLKSNKIAAASLLIVIIGLFAIFAYNFSQREAGVVRAGVDGSPLQGWIWTDTIGWISLNCRNTGTCGDIEYFVSADSGGVLTGYGWSSNIGWVKFGYFNALDKQDLPVPEDSFAGARYVDGSSSPSQPSKIIGWVRIDALDKDVSDASAGQYGWVKLTDDDLGSSSYGVTVYDYDPVADQLNDDAAIDSWGDLTGFAWNGYDNKKGIGWLSFNCNNTDGDCSEPWKASGQPDSFSVNEIKPTDGEDSDSLTIIWDNAYGETYHNILRREYRCVGGARDGKNCWHKSVGSCPPNMGGSFGSCEAQDWEWLRYLDGNKVRLDDADIDFRDGSEKENPRTAELAYFSTYDYRVLGCNIFGCSISGEEAYYTSPIDSILGLDMVPVCRAAADNDKLSYAYLFWNKPYITITYFTAPLAHYEVEYCLLNSSGSHEDCEDSDWQKSSCDGITDEQGKSAECLGGDSHGQICTQASDCPGGVCPMGYCNVAGYTPQFCASDAECDAGIPCKIDTSLRRCSDEILSNKDKYWIYRLRAISEEGVCSGNWATNCQIDNNTCASNPSLGDCELFKSSWAYSDARRICPPSGAYEEIRPE